MVHVLSEGTYDRLIAALADSQVRARDYPPEDADLDEIKMALAEIAGIYPASATADPHFDWEESPPLSGGRP